MPMYWLAIFVLVLMIAGTWIRHRYKALPPGINYASPWRTAQKCRFLYDQSYRDEQDRTRRKRQIMPEMLQLIAGARQRIVLELFLYNDDLPTGPEHVPATETLTRALLVRKKQCPALHITVIVDPVNSLYGAFWPAHFSRLEQAGIEVYETPLKRLRDSNPLWSAIWRLLIAPLGNSMNRGWLPNPTGREPVTIRSWLSVLNFKADHRKLMVADRDGAWAGLVSSANAHDASSAHTNVALSFQGDSAVDLHWMLESTRSLCRNEPPPARPPTEATWVETGAPQLRLLSEGRILEAAQALIDQAEAGDRLNLALFYFSHRTLLHSVIKAADRGVRLRILLDPNKDAFGHVKGGIPNRQVAWELHRRGITVRWYRTQGEQFHAKLALLEYKDGTTDLLLGSANYTRRNLDNLNMESAVQLRGSITEGALKGASEWFERCWYNPPGWQCSVPYENWADHRLRRYLMYRLLEGSGWCSF